jgi:hypothetical protein
MHVLTTTPSPPHRSVLQPYLCDGSVYLLVVPALDVSILKTMDELYVGRWLNALRLGAPNATVIPVMTKGDLLMSAERRDRSSAVLEAACAPQVEWLKSRLEQFQVVTLIASLIASLMLP